MESYSMPGHLIRRLHQLSSQIFVAHARAAGFDITPVQFAAMDALRQNPGIDQAGVAALIAYDRPTIGGVIDRLEAKGLASRRISVNDRRAREVSLTEEGVQLFDAILPVVRDVQAAIVEALNAEEEVQFLKLVRKIVPST